MSLIVFFLCQHAQAATFTVTKTADTHFGICAADCSLRDAIIAANALPGADTIIVPANTYTLSIAGFLEDDAETGDLDITESLTIIGSGATDTIIDGAGLDSVFHIIGVVRFPCTPNTNTPQRCGGLVQMSGLTIRNGRGRHGRTSLGGGILIDDPGSLNLTDSIVSGNLAGNGGGIYNDGGSLTITNSTISGNTGTAGGGGIQTTGTLTVTGSTIEDNQAQIGGAIFNFGGSVTLTNSTISGNTAVTRFGNAGGGIYNSRGSVTLTNSTVSGNTSEDDGGGISSFEGSVTLTNSTISGNAAGRFGGGISNQGGSVTLTNSTISGNRAMATSGFSDAGGGIRGAATLKNTIVANNTAGADCGGAVTSEGYNLDSDATCKLLSVAGDLSGVDPRLGSLQDNGGPTETHALLPGSPAIDHIPPENCAVTTDQQGVARPQGAACDIGAFEVTVTTILIANFMNGNDALLNSRVYLWNPSDSPGNLTVRVFTLPLAGGMAQELTGEPFSLGSLEGKSARNIKLAEDILTPLGILLPYTDDGGNLTLEFTIQAADVRGAAQVFSSSFAFGTYPLQETPLNSSGSSTVLVAHFMNGNRDVFNSRVYLWNSSQSDGNVTVRVFTLPLIGSMTQELTSSPLNLGTLGARSARNIKLAEDILTPLGITTPYINDGGNLTLEFTIQAPDVRGVAQVFSDNLAFGTYPLQETPSFPTSSTSPVVLAANFTNGNNGALNSRIYLWNSSTVAGEITVRVFTLPLIGGLAQELTTSPLSLGTIEARSALNLKVAEDILIPLEIPIPYTTDGGNLSLEISIQEADVGGVVQVFSSDFAFGTYPLEKLPSTLTGSPTVLVANFTNGNLDAFNSRVYLWNPSDSPGNVTVRVFTLPLAGGMAQELTGEPFSLGSLEGKSARNIKLAEDILAPLGIPLPYTDNGGNLTLEFTIQAANVRGATQVFSSSFAFGTYPLEVIQ